MTVFEFKNSSQVVFIKKGVQVWGPQLYLKETPTQVFPCEYCKFFLRTPISRNICERLLLELRVKDYQKKPKNTKMALTRFQSIFQFYTEAPVF